MWVFNTFLLEILPLLLFPWTAQMLPPRLPLQHADRLVSKNSMGNSCVNLMHLKDIYWRLSLQFVPLRGNWMMTELTMGHFSDELTQTRPTGGGLAGGRVCLWRVHFVTALFWQSLCFHSEDTSLSTTGLQARTSWPWSFWSWEPKETSFKAAFSHVLSQWWKANTSS